MFCEAKRNIKRFLRLSKDCEENSSDLDAYIDKCHIRIRSVCENIARREIEYDYVLVPILLDYHRVKERLQLLLSQDECTRGYVVLRSGSNRVLVWYIDYVKGRM